MNHTDTLILRTKEAIRLANINIYLGVAAIICFGVFGTLASLETFKDSNVIYYAFYYLPYVLIAIGVPISVFHALFLWRYRIMQGGILATILLTAISLVLFALGVLMWYGMTATFFMSVFLAAVAWFAIPYVFRVNLKKFLTFLQDKQTQHHKENDL